MKFASTVTCKCVEQITKTTVVCSAHFSNDDYKTAAFTKNQQLKPDATPKIFNWTKEKKKRKLPSERRWEPMCKKSKYSSG